MPVQRRVSDLVEGLDDDAARWMNSRVADEGSERLGDSIEYLRRTGADGRDLLDRVDDAARERLVSLSGSMQRRVAGAADELQPQQVEDFLAWYDSRSTAVRQRVDNLLDRGGDDAVETLAELDDESREILLTDGGEAADDIIRVADDIDDVDAFVDDVLDIPDGTRKQRAIDLIEEGGASGVRLLDDLDDQTRRVLLGMDSKPGFDGLSRWDDWRENLATAHDQPEISTADVESYVDDLGGVSDLAESSDIDFENLDGLVEEIADNPDPGQFVGQQFEVNRVRHYAEDVDEVSEIEIEPGVGSGDPIDLRIRINENQFVEAKNSVDVLNENKVRREIGNAHQSFDATVPPSDGERILSIGAIRRGIDPSVGGSSEEIKDTLAEQLQTFYPRNSNRPDGVQIDTINIVTEDGSTMSFDVDTLYDHDV